MSPRAPIEFTDVRAIREPLVFVEGVEGVGLDEVAEIRMPSGERRHGVVLEVDRDLAVVEVLEGTDSLRRGELRVSFSGGPMRIPLGQDWLGRVCSGRGAPLDGGPPVLGARTSPINGRPMNPAGRVRPSEPVLTGVSAIDGLATLVRGQKLPVFSVGGLPHLELAIQVAAQANVGGEPFAVVFAAIGITHADAAEVTQALSERSARGDLLLLVNTASDPLLERLVTPRIALTVAEDLAFGHGRHVLVVMADLTSYCDAVREVAAARGEIPSRLGYPGYLYSDLASLLERAGRLRDRHGSVTQMPVLTMPGGDITHPVPDLTGYITEGQLVLSKDLHARGVYPPMDLLQSLSRLMRFGIGAGLTRGDHGPLARQLNSLAADARRAGDLEQLLGGEALSRGEQRLLAFNDALETRVIDQGRDERRSLDRTLDLAWGALALVPRDELRMLDEALVREHLGPA